MDRQTTPNEPIETLRDGRLKATVWLNQNKDGEDYATVTLAKTYEDRDGNLQDTSSFSEGELLRVAELAREAKGLLLGMRRERALERQSERKSEKEPGGQERRPRRFRGRDAQPGLER